MRPQAGDASTTWEFFQGALLRARVRTVRASAGQTGFTSHVRLAAVIVAVRRFGLVLGLLLPTCMVRVAAHAERVSNVLCTHQRRMTLTSTALLLLLQKPLFS